jgi:integrase
MVKTFQECVKSYNQRLKAANLGVTIDVKASRLSLRATLPPRPGSKLTKRHQQRVATGLRANMDGLREAYEQAKLLGARVSTGKFDWADYYSGVAPGEETVASAIQRFKHDLCEVKGRSNQTWENHYGVYLGRLPQGAVLSAQVLEQFLLSFPASSCSRRQAVWAINPFVKFLGMDFDSNSYRGTYSSSHPLNPRSIPTDEEIVNAWAMIPNPGWQWVFGMMATYGLRNHEVFRLDALDWPIIRVGENTKTGAREVWPCFPEWVEAFRLPSGKPPTVDAARSNPRLGRMIHAAFKRYVRILPYDLRHAWAIRTIGYGWPVELAARQQGHSVEIHTRTYHQWLDRTHQQRVYERLVRRPDAPQAPRPNGLDIGLHSPPVAQVEK